MWFRSNRPKRPGRSRLKTALMHAEIELAALRKRFTRWMLAFLCVGLLVGIIATVFIGIFV